MQTIEIAKEVIDTLWQIEQDITVPKNVRERVKDSILILKDDQKRIEVKINHSLQELDDISEDPNLPAHTRTQIWHAVSLLESI